MCDEYVNKYHDSLDMRFSWLEEQVTDINRNVKLLMVALRNRLGIFGGEGGLNAEEKS